MQMLKKLFKSKDKYYLELDEIKDSQVVKAVVNTAKDVVEVVQETTADIVESKPVQEAIKTAKEAAADIADSKPVQEAVKNAKGAVADIADSKPVQEAVKTAKGATDVAQTKLQITSQEVKGKKGKAKKKGKQVAEKVQEVAETKTSNTPQNGASSYDPPFWVAAMYKNNNEENAILGKVEKTFATDNLMPIITQYRRRPGPSLNKYKNMAKESRFTK
ncbi:hypothetical protein NIES4102_36680 [Chondrocystis sp. NIES-4102]|nr:hypothetical protein NIES4102_36680 [Chondrocystis sp. NIES-4102]